MNKYELCYIKYPELDFEFTAKTTEEAIRIAEQNFRCRVKIAGVRYAMLYEGRRIIAEIGDI